MCNSLTAAWNERSSASPTRVTADEFGSNDEMDAWDEEGVELAPDPDPAAAAAAATAAPLFA